MKRDLMEKFLTGGKSMILAYDQGLEHGPSSDFNDKNVDPAYIMDIAAKGRFNGVVFQKGVAERFYDGRVPLIVKLNGKSSLLKGEPVSRQVCSVEQAVSLGAKGVGYTIYLGSEHEPRMFSEFGEIQEEAHERGMPAIAWIYPRGAAVQNDTSKETVAYAARAGLELGADAVKIKYTGDPESFSWAVKAAAGVRVFMSGGPKAPTDNDFLRQVEGVVRAGGTGVAVGRNVWQNQDPLAMAGKLGKAIFG
ncbi:MAG: aldolase [Nitrososphaerota archaeon]|jgi:class I fructose-bisphosphate aldolase|nr:aldolase [Nitrososphaerota archaeon]MCL5671956.1 aldolase [Nitrososphaerota archaeon]MDG6936998.1 aldolase [Nitrososphaerota archaeon]MDG6945387.1 aldolase [Nitrososphaerota archaeon]MDG6952145.1 aldolase [Nitrososphaerota archaeon]